MKDWDLKEVIVPEEYMNMIRKKSYNFEDINLCTIVEKTLPWET